MQARHAVVAFLTYLRSATPIPHTLNDAPMRPTYLPSYLPIAMYRSVAMAKPIFVGYDPNKKDHSPGEARVSRV
jgi:hypothetical protein